MGAKPDCKCESEMHPMSRESRQKRKYREYKQISELLDGYVRVYDFDRKMIKINTLTLRRSK